MTDQQNIEAVYKVIQPLTVEEARALLEDKYKLKLSDADPLLMEVDLYAALFRKTEDQHGQHKLEIEEMVSGSSVRCVEAVNDSLKLLKDEALKGSIENTLAMVSQKAKENDRLVQRIRAHGRSIWLATGLVWLAVVALFFILK